MRPNIKPLHCIVFNDIGVAFYIIYGNGRGDDTKQNLLYFSRTEFKLIYITFCSYFLVRKSQANLHYHKLIDLLHFFR